VKVWLDAHLAPGICPWLASEFGVEATPLSRLGLRDADLAHLVTRLGPPPAVLWLTCGNTTNAGLQEFLAKALGEALDLIQGGEPLVRLAVAPAG